MKELSCFKQFFHDYDFLQLSLQWHQSSPELFGQKKAMLQMDLNDYFPELKVNAHLRGLGFLELIPKDHSPCEHIFVLSAGLHGNETAPIEIVRDIVKDILAGKMEVKVPTLVILGHLEAMIVERRQVEENLNRCFDPKEELHYSSRSQEEARAYQIKQVVAQFHQTYGKAKRMVHYDLHTAIRESLHKRFCVIPLRESVNKWHAPFFASLGAMGVEAALLSNGPTTTFSHYTSMLYQAYAATVELGSVKKFGLNNLDDFKLAQNELRRFLITGEFIQKGEQLSRMVFYDIVRTLKRQSADFKLLFAENLPNFSKFAANTPIMEDGGRIFTIHADDERIVFPNSKVKIGERVGLIVKPRILQGEAFS